MITVAPHQIHIIEDSQADFLALRRAVSWAASQLKATVEFTHHQSSQEAFDALLAGGAPDLMFIDINLRGETGVDFLRRVKAEPRIDPYPKVILTTSTSEVDVKNSFGEGAAGYLVKPINHQDLRESMKTCLDYWFVTSRRPSSGLETDTPRC